MLSQPPALEKLKQALVKLKESDDTEEAHRCADKALLEYIDDADVTELFDSLKKWYA